MQPKRSNQLVGILLLWCVFSFNVQQIWKKTEMILGILAGNLGDIAKKNHITLVTINKKWFWTSKSSWIIALLIEIYYIEILHRYIFAYHKFLFGVNNWKENKEVGRSSSELMIQKQKSMTHCAMICTTARLLPRNFYHISTLWGNYYVINDSMAASCLLALDLGNLLWGQSPFHVKSKIV